jgi:hypothetical protein
MAVTIVPWPAGLPKCASAWEGAWEPASIRTELDGGHVKVRKRFTKPVRRASVKFILLPDQYEVFKQLYENDTQCGVLPMMLETPVGPGHAPQTWRFAAPPTYTALGKPPVAWEAAVALEQLPYWG